MPPATFVKVKERSWASPPDIAVNVIWPAPVDGIPPDDAADASNVKMASALATLTLRAIAKPLTEPQSHARSIHSSGVLPAPPPLTLDVPIVGLLGLRPGLPRPGPAFRLDLIGSLT